MEYTYLKVTNDISVINANIFFLPAELQTLLKGPPELSDVIIYDRCDPPLNEK